MTAYYQRNNQNLPSASNDLFRENEATVEYLIQLADQHKLNTRQILNHKGKDGTTLFYLAAYFSEKMAKILIQRNDVEVNTVDQLFMTPEFRVINSFLIVILIFNLVSIDTPENDRHGCESTCAEV